MCTFFVLECEVEVQLDIIVEAPLEVVLEEVELVCELRVFALDGEVDELLEDVVEQVEEGVDAGSSREEKDGAADVLREPDAHAVGALDDEVPLGVVSEEGGEGVLAVVLLDDEVESVIEDLVLLVEVLHGQPLPVEDVVVHLQEVVPQLLVLLRHAQDLGVQPRLAPELLLRDREVPPERLHAVLVVQHLVVLALKLHLVDVRPQLVLSFFRPDPLRLRRLLVLLLLPQHQVFLLQLPDVELLQHVVRILRVAVRPSLRRFHRVRSKKESRYLPPRGLDYQVVASRVDELAQVIDRVVEDHPLHPRQSIKDVLLALPLVDHLNQRLMPQLPLQDLVRQLMQDNRILPVFPLKF